MTLRLWLLFLVLPLVGGCSAVGVRIKPEPTQSAAIARQSALLEAERHFAGALRGDLEARRRYNAAVGRVVQELRENDFQSQAITIRRRGPGVLDPAACGNIVRAETIKIRGLRERVVQEGFGVPYVFSYPAYSTQFQGQPGIPPAGLSIPATAFLTFGKGRPVLTFQDTIQRDEIQQSGRTVRLAADFSAPIAMMIARGKNRRIDLASLLESRRNLERAGLFQFQPYDPGRIPVVFVHGLISRPEVWMNTLNELLAARDIRTRYQFWFFLYPTGLPVWKSAALLRSELDRFHDVLGGDQRDVVLVGHSMGGLISSLTVRQGGEKLWRQFSQSNFEELAITPEARSTLEDLIFFPERRDVARVIYVATPHRGSGLAMNPVARLGSRLIRLPNLLDRSDRREILSALDQSVTSVFTQPVTSLRFLQANSPLLVSILNLPLSRKTPYHSIIGDRGRGDSPDSSDGVVPYWSSHLPSAESEKIVPSDHGAQDHPAAIAEMKRILREHR